MFLYRALFCTGLLAPLCVLLVYHWGALLASFLVNISDMIIHPKKKKKNRSFDMTL